MPGTAWVPSDGVAVHDVVVVHTFLALRTDFYVLPPRSTSCPPVLGGHESRCGLEAEASVANAEAAPAAEAHEAPASAEAEATPAP